VAKDLSKFAKIIQSFKKYKR